MSTYIGIGFSKDLDTAKAAQEAAEQAKYNLRHEQIDLALVLNTVHYNPNDFVPAIHDQLKKTKLIGSSTSAIMFNGRIETRGIAVLTIYSEEIRFQAGAIDHLNMQDLHAAGCDLAKSCLTDYGKEQRKLFIFFADGLIQDFSRCLAGLTETFENKFPLVGAGSCDDFHYQQTHQYFNNTVLTSGACGFLIGGRVQVGSSCRHGWRPLGKPHSIDQHEGNVIRSIDNKPAAHIYQQYFNSEAESLRATSLAHLNNRYPLGVPLARGREYLVRNVIHTLDDSSLVFQDSVPEGKQIHLMIGNKESCLRAAELAAKEVKEQLQNRVPKLILIFESQSRYRILGRSAFTEIQMIWDILGNTAPLIGMYTFGEIFTHTDTNGSETLFQNESIIITAIF